MKCIFRSAILLIASLSLACAQRSPRATTTVTIGGKTLTINYSAPSVRGRDIFGAKGIVRQDPTYPAWRAGANAATSFHSDADLDIKGLKVPKGDYTIYVWVETPQWQLIINKQTGQWGLSYEKSMDVGRVPMDMAKPPAPIEKYKMTLSTTGASTGKLQLEWENFVASVPFTAN